MSRFTFAALASLVLGSAAVAQQVPGRDLLEFPIGLLAEPGPLSSRMAGGLWNPASAALGDGARARIGIAGLTTPTDQGVDLTMIGSAYRLRNGTTLSLSYAQASVRDIFRTTTDPQTLGEIPYETSVLSLGASRVRGALTLGLAARLRGARFDDERSSVGSLDAGFVLDGVGRAPVRLAASTFLLSPSRSREAATFAAAADAPVVKRDSTFVLRGGYALSHTEGRGREDYVFTSTAYRDIDASAGIVQSDAYGHVSRRLRLGVGLRYAGYSVAFGREDGAGGISATYQVLLTRVFR